MNVQGICRACVRLGLAIWIALLMCPQMPAQSWTWSLPFNHNEEFAGLTNDTSQSNPYVPWGGVQGERKPEAPTGQFYKVPPGYVGEGLTFGWPTSVNEIGRSFNAVHMALIPKGRYRGMVMVWNIEPAMGKHPASVGGRSNLHRRRQRSRLRLRNPQSSLHDHATPNQSAVAGSHARLRRGHGRPHPQLRV
jgi:hypothetical protein